MSNIDKQWLQQKIAEMEELRDLFPGDLDDDHARVLSAFRIALASLEVEKGADPVAFINGAWTLVYYRPPKELGLKIGDKLYTAPPAPVSVPTFDEWLEIRGNKPLGWVKDAMRESYDAFRAAMQGKAEQPQNSQQNIPENIPATQFKPVADLYGITSPTGDETSFTFDAVEARDFIDGGWSCQEYVELERYQAAMVNHPEDNLDMVDHSGDANEKGNSSVIPDCSCRTCRPVTMTDMRFVVCPECGNKRCPHANDHRNACTGSNEPGQEGSAYPAAPQQEVK